MIWLVTHYPRSFGFMCFVIPATVLLGRFT